MSKKNSHKLPPHEVIRVFEGFAGYGGASFGLKRSGLNYKVIGMSEFNPFASKLLEANFPKIKNWGDITKIDPKELPDFDMFTGGFPCQPFSSAGMQMGEDDRYGRGTLFYENFEAWRKNVLRMFGGDKYFVRPNFLVGGKETYSTAHERFLHLGNALDDMFTKLFRSSYNSNRWLKFFATFGAGLLGVTVLSQFFFGHMHTDRYEAKQK